MFEPFGYAVFRGGVAVHGKRIVKIEHKRLYIIFIKKVLVYVEN